METKIIDPSQVRGWGIDADPKNDPTYPLKKHAEGEHAGYSWERPTLQPTTVEILQSNERPSLTAVFGTSTPPAGLSGMLRRFAFQYSESSYGHWLPLVLADRVGVTEGILSDLIRGHIPDIPGELGAGAEWKHNRKNLVLGVLISAAFALAVRTFLSNRTTNTQPEK